MANKIGQVIKAKREEKKITQLELSENTGVSRNYISDIETGRYIPSVKTLIKITSYLKINLNFLSQMSEIQEIK